MTTEVKRIEVELAYLILQTERILTLVQVSQSFKLECNELGKIIDRLSQILRSIARFSASNSSCLYENPIRRVVFEVSKNLDKTLTLVRKCRRRSVIHRVVSIVTVFDFRKVSNLIESSISDGKWILSIFDSDRSSGGIVLSLPPIASNDPILAWVWSFIAAIQMGDNLVDQIEAANELCSLAVDNDRNKKIIVEEGGVVPLLKLLKEASSVEAQVAAATALLHLANEQERVRVIVDELGVPIIVKVLGNLSTKVQIQLAKLIANMAKSDHNAQEDFAREKVIRPLVSLLAFEAFDEDLKLQLGKQSLHSLVQINKDIEKKMVMPTSHTLPYANSFSSSHLEGSCKNGNQRRERENEKPEIKLSLKISCSEALWMLARGSISNTRRITETKGLLCLAKLIESEKGELQHNCLMTVMEITAAAESNADLRRAAFKTNSPAAKAVIEQLLRVIRDEDHNPGLRIPAIKSIGSLARTFPARETGVIIGPLVINLSHKNQDVATEAAISLGKFACPDNFLHMEHSKAIIEFNGVQPLMRLLRGGTERAQLQGLILLCYLAIDAGNSEALEHSRVLTMFEGADRIVASASAQFPGLRELVTKAINHLNLYHAVVQPQRQAYTTQVNKVTS